MSEIDMTGKVVVDKSKLINVLDNVETYSHSVSVDIKALRDAFYLQNNDGMVLVPRETAQTALAHLRVASSVDALEASRDLSNALSGGKTDEQILEEGSAAVDRYIKDKADVFKRLADK